MKEFETDFNYAPEEVKEEWMDLVGQISNASAYVKREKWQHFTPKFLDTETQEFSTLDAEETMAHRQDLYNAEKIGQLEAHVQIDTDMPVTVFHIGDVHWGSIFTNNALWDNHRQNILNTPGAYVMFYHNMVDNGIPSKYPNNILNNGVPPDIQFKTMQTWIKELNDHDKVLAVLEGDCHEGWSWNVAGISAANLLYGFEGRKFPVIENGGIVYVTVGEQEYGIGMYHKQGPFNSRFNPEHSLRQNRRLYHEGKTDVEVGAHHHVAAASQSWVGSKGSLKEVSWLRVGTYKGVPSFPGQDNNFIVDTWANDRMGISGEPPAPSSLFWNNEHNVDVSLDFETGIEKHLAVRTLALVREMGLEEEFRKLTKNNL